MTVFAQSTLFLKQIIICIHCIIIGRSPLGIALQNVSLDKAFVILDSENSAIEWWLYPSAITYPIQLGCNLSLREVNLMGNFMALLPR